MNRPSEAHEFAFYTEALPESFSLEVGAHSTIRHKELVHRIGRVVRLSPGDRCILFNNRYALSVLIEHIELSSSFSFLIEAFHVHAPLKPEVHWLLPLLKRDAFEEALYSLVELGATSIRPFTAAKTGRLWLGEKERARCQALMVAAAEQSKNFVLPHLYPLAPLTAVLGQVREANYSYSLFLDASGTQASECIPLLVAQRPRSVVLCSGPEGDLTAEEKELLVRNHFTFMALTPTVLRAQQAVVVGLGLVRSFIRS